MWLGVDGERGGGGGGREPDKRKCRSSLHLVELEADVEIVPRKWWWWMARWE